MNACCIDRIYGMQSWYFFWHRRACNLMDQRAKAGILLRRPSYHGKRPDSVLTVINVMHLQQWERVYKAVITQVVAKRAFGLVFVRINGAGYHKISVRRKAKALVIIKIPKTAVTQRACKGHFG